MELRLREASQAHPDSVYPVGLLRASLSCVPHLKLGIAIPYAKSITQDSKCKFGSVNKFLSKLCAIYSEVYSDPFPGRPIKSPHVHDLTLFPP